MNKLKLEIIYQTAISNNKATISEVVVGCRNYGELQKIKWTIDTLIDENVLEQNQGTLKLVKPSEFYFYRDVVNGNNILTCTEIDGLIRSLLTGRNPRLHRKQLLASIGTMVDMARNEMASELTNEEFKARFIKAAMRIIKKDMGVNYENK